MVRRKVRAWLETLGVLLEGPAPYRKLASMLGGMALSWWLYVPCHELLHAAGCWLGGGTVTKLEIQARYGGGLLARVFPFVVAESEYAGRLSGFDTAGSDWTYALTVFFPFLLVFPGLAWAARAVRRRSAGQFGMSVPLALGPLISATGDYLELGSLLLYQFWPGDQGAHRQLVSDDLFRLVGEISGAGFGTHVLFVLFAQVTGLVLIGLTLGVAGAVVNRLGLGLPKSGLYNHPGISKEKF